MKPLFISALLILCVFHSEAQEYSDLIVKKFGDTIRCSITLVNDQNIFYNHKPKKTELNDHIKLDNVHSCKYRGEVLKLMAFEWRDKSEPLMYSEVIKVPGISKSTLYNRGGIWFATTFGSNSQVIQLSSEEKGQFLGNAIMEHLTGLGGGGEFVIHKIKYTIQIYVKEGRYKYILSDFRHTSPDFYNLGLITNRADAPHVDYAHKKERDQLWDNVSESIKSQSSWIIADLKASMAQKSESEKDW